MYSVVMQSLTKGLLSKVFNLKNGASTTLVKSHVTERSAYPYSLFQPHQPLKAFIHSVTLGKLTLALCQVY